MSLNLINAQCKVWSGDETRLIAKGNSNLLKTKRQRQVNYAMSNTFGFGGHIETTIYKNTHTPINRP